MTGPRLGAPLWWGMAALVVGLWMGGLLVAPVIPGLPTEPLVTIWLLPLTHYARDIAAALTVGATVTALLVLPDRKAQLARWATGWSLVWLALLVPLTLLTVSEVGAAGAGDSLYGMGAFLADTLVGRVLVAQAVLVLAVVLLARARGPWSWVVAALALVAAALPALLGHGGLSGEHVAATVSLGLHVAAISLWTGGLAVVVAMAAAEPTGARLLLSRFSLLALWCVIVVGETGLLSASLRLALPSQFAGTLYGSIVLLKAVLLGFLIRWGWLQRSRALPEVADGRRAALARYAGWELLTMGGAIALGIVLARLGPPNPTAPGTGFTPVALSVLAIGVPLLLVVCASRRPRWVAALAGYPEAAALGFLIVVAVVGVVGLPEALLGPELGALLGAMLLVGAGWCWLAATGRGTSWIDVALVMVAWPVIMWLTADSVTGPGAHVPMAIATTVAVEALLAFLLIGRVRRVRTDAREPVAVAG
ncbi:MAG: CopD family protein [Actinobacteria bacterium]|nr:CopD family protein [Actinomycetota bacterium]